MTTGLSNRIETGQRNTLAPRQEMGKLRVMVSPEVLASTFGVRVPFPGTVCAIPVTEITQVMGESDVDTALKEFTAWAEAHGMKAWQLTMEVMVLGRHLSG